MTGFKDGGATGLAVYATATPAEARTVIGASWRDAVDPRDFGLVVSTNTATAAANTVAMQAALDSGKDVILPNGTFWCGPVTQTTAWQTVQGTKLTRWRHPAGAGANLITIAATATGATWRGFRIDGNRGPVTYVYNNSEILNFATDVTVEDMDFRDCQSMGVRWVGPAHRGRILNNHFQNIGDFAVFVLGSGGDPLDGLISGNTVIDFGIEGGGGGTTPSVGLGVRSVGGGWRCIGNNVSNTVSRTNDQLGIEFWTDSNNGIITGNEIDFSGSGTGEFGISATGYGMVVGDNIIRGTSSYAIEIIDRAATVTGNVLRSPVGAGISVNLNSGHADPGDLVSITGNTIEDANTTDAIFAMIDVNGTTGLTPIGITITGNTLHGRARGIRVMVDVRGYTIGSNTIYNTGGTLTSIAALGSQGTVSGNTIVRDAAAGAGDQTSGIFVQGIGVMVGSNYIQGNSRMTHGIVINAAASKVVVAPNFVDGVTGQYLISNSTADSIVIQGGAGYGGIGLQSANRAFGYINMANQGVSSQQSAPAISTYTVANLPIDNIQVGQLAYATNGRKNGEGPGAGTGVLCFRDGTDWRAVDTGATVAA